MRKLFATPLLSAVLGGGVTAAVLLATGLVQHGQTTTVYRQSALASPPMGATGDGALTARQIYKRDAPGVTYIRAHVISASSSPFGGYDTSTSSQETEETGSGFVLDRDGHVLTNAHVIDHAITVTVTFGKVTRDAQVVGKDESTDLALLKVDPQGLDLQPLELGDSSTVQVGDPTIAIGNPFGYDRTLTTGVVSALQRRITAPDDYTIDNVIQTDAALNPGNSGGPLIDAAGRVIGINSQIATGGSGSGNVGIGFAIPIDTAKRIVAELKLHGRVERPWIGVEYVPVNPSLQSLGIKARAGLLVTTVRAGGPAQRAGMLGGTQSIVMPSGEELVVGGDVITRVDGRPVAAPDDLRRLLDLHKPGQVVAVQINRGGQLLTLKVTLGNRPADSSDS